MTDLQPCGVFHPLPCALDADCPVPIQFYQPDEDSEEIYERYTQA